MARLSQITPETTYAEIQGQVEANLKEGYGIPYECLILMARNLDKQTKELAKTKASLEDARARLPEEDANAEHHRRRRLKASEAAMRVCEYLVRAKPGFMEGLSNEDKIDLEDFLELLRFNGYSTDRYEG